MSDYNLDIAVVSGGQVPFTGRDYYERALGGSESSAVLMAEELVKRDNNVCVFTPGDEITYGSEHVIEHNGVVYYRMPETWQAVTMTRDFDVALIQRDYGRLTSPLLRTRQLGLLNHDILTNPREFMEHAYPLDFLYCLTEWHRTQYEHLCPDLRGKVSVLGNPLDTTLLEAVKEKVRVESGMAYKHSRPTFMYTSRPERGLLLLLKFIWPEILTLYPDAELHVCYYPVDKEKLPADIVAIHQACETLMGQIPGVIYLGGLPKRGLYELIYRSHAVLYPCVFPEVHCISACEAQILGTPYLTTDMFAMRETVIDPAHRIFDYEVLNKLYYDNSIQAPTGYKFLTDKVKKLLTNCVEYHKDHPLTTAQAILTAAYDKARIAEHFELECRARFAIRSRTKGKRIIQNLIYHSDYVAAKVIMEQYMDASIPTTEYEQVTRLLSTHHEDPEEYHVHASHDVSKHTNCPPRMARALEHIQAFVGEKEFTLTDCGVGEGIMLYHVLKTFGKQVQIQGVDFSQGMLDMTWNLIRPFYKDADVRLPNFLMKGDPFGDLLDLPIEQADIVFCGEILEHQIDVVKALTVIEELCRPGGLIVLTLPYGPWEAIASDMQEHIYHVQHFERRDLHEILVRYEGRYTMELVHPQHAPRDHALCANWVVTIKKPDPDHEGGPLLAPQFHYPNYQRKFETTRPYINLGMTCITKNEEDNVAGFLKPLLATVDHVLLYDTGSQDGTVELADKILSPANMVYADTPEIHTEVVKRDSGPRTHTVVHGYWDDDFAGARNRGLELLLTRGIDWVLWGDL